MPNLEAVAEKESLRSFVCQAFSAANLNSEKIKDEYLVRRAVSELPRRERVIIYLTFWEGMSVFQIAQFTDLWPREIKHRLDISLSRIRRRLHELGFRLPTTSGGMPNK